jgi:hypothetical protein
MWPVPGELVTVTVTAERGGVCCRACQAATWPKVGPLACQKVTIDEAIDNLIGNR